MSYLFPESPRQCLSFSAQRLPLSPERVSLTPQFLRDLPQLAVHIHAHASRGRDGGRRHVTPMQAYEGARMAPPASDSTFSFLSFQDFAAEAARARLGKEEEEVPILFLRGPGRLSLGWLLQRLSSSRPHPNRTALGPCLCPCPRMWHSPSVLSNNLRLEWYFAHREPVKRPYLCTITVIIQRWSRGA